MKTTATTTATRATMATIDTSLNNKDYLLGKLAISHFCSSPLVTSLRHHVLRSKSGKQLSMIDRRNKDSEIQNENVGDVDDDDVDHGGLDDNDNDYEGWTG